jgi:hypothetical protein
MSNAIILKGYWADYSILPVQWKLLFLGYWQINHFKKCFLPNSFLQDLEFAKSHGSTSGFWITGKDGFKGFEIQIFIQIFLAA